MSFVILFLDQRSVQDDLGCQQTPFPSNASTADITAAATGEGAVATVTQEAGALASETGAAS